MSSYIKIAQDNIRNIVEQLVASEKSDIQLALVEYRDHPPQDTTFVTRTHDFTPSVSKMKEWLNNSSAQGGGDMPEAVADALHDVYKLSWRENSTKICVLISDAPPHGLMQSGDGFPDGSPSGVDPMVVVRQMAEKGITLYSVGCEPSIIPYKEFFSAIAYLTGGQYVPLTAAKLLTQVIIGGAQEEMSLEKFMAEVDEEVQKEMAAGREINEEEMSRRIHSIFKSKGIVTKQLQRNAAELDEASATSQIYSAQANMAELKSKFTPMASPHMASLSMAPGFGGGAMRRSRGAPMYPPMASPHMASLSMAPGFGGGAMRRSRGAPMYPPMASPHMASLSMAPGFGGGAMRRSRGAPMYPTPLGMGEYVEAMDTGDRYETVETAATEQQVKRMVQKSKMRNVKKF
ncbi:hypothetical protein FSP39_003171 [Pinctada imbricata]|nr:hypothetical protein FSP39_003171 [Pinctada imbricata]